jgi:hypothetical protein
MKLKLQEYLVHKGWMPADQEKDFGYVMQNVLYYRKEFKYVSVVFYKDQFVEAIFELWGQEKNTRNKNVSALSRFICRTLTELDSNL